jgi:hypothetical protein
MQANRGQSPIRAAILAAGVCLASPAHAQSDEARTLEVSGGANVSYTLRTHPADAHLAKPGTVLAPTSAVDTARLLHLHLSSGDILEAAVLSNAPRRRFEVLREFRDSVGEEEFKKVFSHYLSPQNRLLAEIAIDRHRLLIWDLKEGASRIAGQYFVEIEGRYYVDDVPNDTRTSLRWVLEAYRAGKLR